MQYKVLNINNKLTRKLFLSLPSKLYKSCCPQNKQIESQILTGKHCLSVDFSVYPFVVVDSHGTPIARCLLTCYPNDDTAYLGFFEAFNVPQAVKDMMIYVERQAKDLHKLKIVGPIDSSIYIRYRFKVNDFESTYSSEPYNKDYYHKLWQLCGFTICTTYTSNKMRVPTSEDVDTRLTKMYNKYTAGDYRIVSPTNKDFKLHLVNVYKLMMATYTNFNGFKFVSEKQFVNMFSSIKKLLNFSMVRLLYKANDLKGFAICLPNYDMASKQTNIITKLRTFYKLKRNPKECVILYVGADPKTVGAGGALMEDIKLMCQKRQMTSIGALIRTGNAPDRMYPCLKTTNYEYVLLAKNL